jgi:hypothetical protein
MLAGLSLAGCGSVSASARLAAWRTTSNFDTNTATVRGDAHRALGQLRAIHATQLDLNTVCAVFLNDVEAANASLPTPDAQASSLLATAYNDLGAGASACMRAGSSAVRRQRAIVAIERGANELVLGVSRLDALR